MVGDWIRMKTNNRQAVICLGLSALVASALMLQAAERARSTAGLPARRTSARLKQATSRPAGTTSRPATAPAAVGTRPSSTPVTVYYFHRTMRCPTCLRIEELARDAVQHGFADEVAAGTVKWQAINTEKPENRHFEKEFDLKAQSLVIVKTKPGERQKWSNMTEIWDLVDDPAGFTKYVQKGIRQHLDANPATRP